VLSSDYKSNGVQSIPKLLLSTSTDSLIVFYSSIIASSALGLKICIGKGKDVLIVEFGWLIAI
jgi:hypothetical protein